MLGKATLQNMKESNCCKSAKSRGILSKKIYLEAQHQFFLMAEK